MAFGSFGYNPQYYAPQYQPVYQPQMSQTAQQQNSGITWVQGEAGAKAFPVRPGESALLMDSENSMMYLKSADLSGMPSMRYFSVNELKAEDMQAASSTVPKIDYATQEDLTKVKEEITKVRKMVKSIRDSMEGGSNE